MKHNKSKIWLLHRNVYTVATEWTKCLLSMYYVDRLAGSLILLDIVNVLVDTRG